MLETLSLMGQGFVNALTFINILAMAGGVAIGIVIGCLPGLSAAMGVALMLPLTFTMPADTGLIVLGAIYCGAIFGGSISAILIHTPGTPASAATAIEGYQMTLQGKAGKALATACWSSFWGGLLSCISLYFFAPMLAQLALKFMSAEKFWLGIFGLTIIAGVSSKSLLKGLMSGAMGLIISCIGLDPIDGTKRFMFGQSFLADGINTTCALIGLFSMSQVFILAEKEIKKRQKAAKFSDKISLTREERKKIRPTIIRSWIIGNIIGILPGAGASIACFLGYNTAKQFSKNKEEFGHGAIEGVAGSEAANNAVTGGSLIPMLTLGIPGESVTAVLMGGLIIQGLTPGPELFTKHAAMTYTFFAGFVLVQFFMLAIGMIGCRGFAQISRLSDAILIPCVTVLCVIGSYAIHKNMSDVVVMILFGVLGYLMRKFDLNTAAVVLALILGPISEKGLRGALRVSGGDISCLFTSPVSWVLIILSIVGICSPFIMDKLERKVVGDEAVDEMEGKT
jgi:putative tricarboxylic transport membrane protein